jgi:WD40-like Beta Propeller Repeat
MSGTRRAWASNALAAGGLALAIASLCGGAVAAKAPARTKLVPLPMFAGEFGAWSPDSSQVAVPGTKKISLYDVDGKLRRNLRGAGIRYFGFPCECAVAWTADGNRIQFVSEEEDLEEASVIGSVAADGSGEEDRTLGVPIGAAAWAPSGWPLIYVPDARTRNAVTGKALGPTPDLWRLESLRAKPEKILASPGTEWDPQFSPDGTQITFQRESRRSTSLWIANADGTDPRRLVASLLGPTEDAWSPDGHHIALSTFSRKRGDRRCHLYVVSPTGGRPHQIVREEIRTIHPAWTPDGRWITFATYSGAIRNVRPDSTGLRTIAEFPGKEVSGLSWSPDGRYLTYSARTPPHTD